MTKQKQRRATSISGTFKANALGAPPELPPAPEPTIYYATVAWNAPIKDQCGHRHRSIDAAGRCAVRHKFECVQSTDQDFYKLGFVMSESDTSMIPVLVDQRRGDVHGVFVGQYLERLPEACRSKAS